jgi:hypothetical protein
VTTSNTEITQIDDMLWAVIVALQATADAQFGAAGDAAATAQDTGTECDELLMEAWEAASIAAYTLIADLVAVAKRLGGLADIVNREFQEVADSAVKSWAAGEFDV